MDSDTTSATETDAVNTDNTEAISSEDTGSDESDSQDIGQQATSEPANSSEGESAQDDGASSGNHEVTLQQIVDGIIDAFSETGTNEEKTNIKAAVCKYLEQRIAKHPVSSKYNIVIMYDEIRMVEADADNIYKAVVRFQDKRPCLLILHSVGGYMEPAYLIGKMLQEYSHGDLEVVVPRRAKSAATLLSCAAVRIHMGSLSELGPIDPQIGNMPALGLKSAIKHIAALVAEHPQATELFAKYMSETIKPISLGYYERVAESATQYAQRLLNPNINVLEDSPEKISKQLVYEYKDHRFAIDRHEAQKIFGKNVVKHNTDEYMLGNSVYSDLDLISRVAGFVDHDFYMIGSALSTPTFIKKKS